MRELIELSTVERLFQLLATVLPIAGAIIGAGIGAARRQNIGSGAVRGFLWGLLGVVNYGLWRVYNILTDANGLDSVRGLLINFALFTVMGIVGGIVWAKRVQKSETVSAPPVENA
jgi:hypothetical protein